MKQFYLHNGTQQQGPYELEELRFQNITQSTLVWFDTLKEWTPASQVPELQTLIKPSLPTQNPSLPFQQVQLKENQSSSKRLTNKQKIYLAVGVVLIVGTIAWLAIESKYKKQEVEELTRNLISTQQKATKLTNEIEAAAKQKKIETEEQQKVEKTREEKRFALNIRNFELRNNWQKYMTADLDAFNALAFGGFSGISIKAGNMTDYPIDLMIARIIYWKENGDIYKSEDVSFTDIQSNSVSYVNAPNSSRGTKLTIDIRKITSRQFNFCFDSQDIPGTDHVFGGDRDHKDPWRCEKNK